MKKFWKSFLLISLFLFLMPISGGCDGSSGQNKATFVLFTNDVHSHIDTNISYSGAAAMKQELQAQGNNVFLVDSGDIVQGDVVSTVSKGEIPVRIFDLAGYDFYTLGNHEFGYGVQRLSELMDMTKAQCVNCNIIYTGTASTPAFLTKVKPYVIKQSGDKKIAFIGVTTPDCPESLMPGTFAEDGKIVYSFFGGHNASDEGLAQAVQPVVNECRKQGADYVILLSHLGDSESAHTSRALIKNSYGIDVVLDGHDHHVITGELCRNKDNKDVLLCSTGRYFANIGKLTIDKDGKISSELISSYQEKDAIVAAAVEKARKTVDEILSDPVGTSDFELPITSPSGARMVRCRETGIGNLCADSLALDLEAQIAAVNGGGICAPLPCGIIKNSDVLSVWPFENGVCMIEIKGSDLLDALELSCSQLQKESESGGRAVGESGGFLSVHGLKFTVDSSIPSPVIYESKNGSFIIKGTRRVSDVWLTDSNGSKIEQINSEKKYSFATNNYLLQGGDGYAMLTKYEPVKISSKTDYEILRDTIKITFCGKMPDRYKEAEGRINIK